MWTRTHSRGSQRLWGEPTTIILPSGYNIKLTSKYSPSRKYMPNIVSKAKNPFGSSQAPGGNLLISHNGRKLIMYRCKCVHWSDNLCPLKVRLILPTKILLCISFYSDGTDFSFCLLFCLLSGSFPLHFSSITLETLFLLVTRSWQKIYTGYIN